MIVTPALSQKRHSHRTWRVEVLGVRRVRVGHSCRCRSQGGPRLGPARAGAPAACCARFGGQLAVRHVSNHQLCQQGELVI